MHRTASVRNERKVKNMREKRVNAIDEDWMPLLTQERAQTSAISVLMIVSADVLDLSP